MLVTPDINIRNRREAWVAAGLVALAAAWLGWLISPLWLLIVFSPLTYRWVRRRCLRRLAIMAQPFPSAWEGILLSHVAFYRALDEANRVRFRQLIQIFLDEVRIIGIRTEVDDTVRLLVAASAVIPIFGFHDWTYHRLREVLIYPDAFNETYRTTGEKDAAILGMAGLHHLSGVMILSKPALLAGFDHPSGHHHVGVHEFAHLIEREEQEYGLPPEVPWLAVRQWVHYVARELDQPTGRKTLVDPYAYTNEHEYFAVLAEYFFTSPASLEQRDPALYALMRKLFHQDTRSLLSLAPRTHGGLRRNQPCPCGSGKKYKHCCLATLVS